MDQVATESGSVGMSGSAGGKTLCLNMIVRNERANLERCLAAVADHIGCWVICDTGSTDGTQDFIREFFSRRGIPGELHEFPFENFEQARNAALERALASPLEFDYLLLDDADMELVVEDKRFRQKLTAASYLLIQRAGVTYWNARLVRRDARARYRGVTHEYLDVAEGTERLEGAWFIDHASGANRVNKYERDIQLLLKGLEAEPASTRYWYYLAQSYRDAGRHREAAETYAKRAGMGGWDEEVWSSRLYEGRCLKELGDEGGFLRAALQAHALRPHRAEALHDLARHYRLRSDNATALLFSEPGCKLPVPAGDILFIESWVYEYGLLDEFAVSAYWVGRYRESLEICERLLAEEKIPAHERQRIANNAQFARDRIAEQAGTPENAAPPAAGAPESGWIPDAPAAGTELMVAGLRERLGGALDRINLQVNHPGPDGDDRPRVAWMHHDVDQRWVQWCGDAKLVDTVDRFVFVSEWQRDRYLGKFGLPAERCVVLRNATDVSPESRRWEAEPVWRCAYTSTPFRGLSVLLDAWERLTPANAELHIWSSMKLYLQDDAPYRHLYERAQSLPGVTYHGIVPNAELRAELRRMHFLVYPSTFPETSCLAVIEAMAAGCRVIVPSLGALPETTGQFARLYPWTPDPDAHAKVFADVVASELANPWLGRTALSEAQRQHGAAAYDWAIRVEEWQKLAGTLLADRAASVTPPQIAARAGVAKPPRRPAASAKPPVFIHASWRTSSTWFWGKFRELPETTGFFEPFGALLGHLTREQVMEWDYKWWDSGHPPGSPYCLEFLPLMRKSGGVRLFHPDIPDRWFVPEGGLRGELRQPEKRYLSLLMRHADRGDTVPVFGFTNSLGRIWPLKQSFGGFHIFQYRDLWRQWLSYVDYRTRNYPCFYDSVAEFIARDDDPYLAEIAQIHQKKLGKTDSETRASWQDLLQLPVHDVFSVFMALHIYLYLHGELVADLSVDATGLARDLGYRRGIERSISDRTGLTVSFDDAQEVARFTADDSVNIDAIDWAEIRRHAQAAADALSGLGDWKRLSERAMDYVDSTIAEARAA